MTHHLLACGKQLPIAAPVILWDDEAGFDAYKEHRLFSPGRLPIKPAKGCNHAIRYGHRSYCRVHGTLDQLRGGLRYVVFHHSVTRTARDTMLILHDRRGLSVHLLIADDDNGGYATIYQTLDLRERDRGGGGVNNWAVNVEITCLADPDAYPNRYRRPILEGEIHGRMRRHWGYSPAQLRTCEAIAATLCATFPGVAPLAPWNHTTVLDDPLNQRAFGILGHYHVDRRKRKWDPHTAIGWIRLQQAAAKTTLASLDQTFPDPFFRQRAIQCAGYALPKYGADGKFGAESQTALERLRRDAGLDGEGWGPEVEEWIATQVR
jgi:N-acetyl-anhydromuramyl-L-alanine amidase AmpD